MSPGTCKTWKGSLNEEWCRVQRFASKLKSEILEVSRISGSDQHRGREIKLVTVDE